MNAYEAVELAQRSAEERAAECEALGQHDAAQLERELASGLLDALLTLEEGCPNCA